MHKQFSTHISGFIKNKLGVNMYASYGHSMRSNTFGVRSNEVNDFKLFSFRYAFTINIPLSLSTEITKSNYAGVKLN